jgi:hypothetical protein
MGTAAPLVPVDPTYARKLVRELEAWARSIGFAPHKDFAMAERLFGDVDLALCETDFRFGRDGKPFYMPGPSESPSQIRRRVEHIRKTLGEDNFDFGVLEVDALDEDEEIEPPQPER